MLWSSWRCLYCELPVVWDLHQTPCCVLSHIIVSDPCLALFCAALSLFNLRMSHQLLSKGVTSHSLSSLFCLLIQLSFLIVIQPGVGGPQHSQGWPVGPAAWFHRTSDLRIANYILALFFETDSLYTPDYPGTHYVDQAGLISQRFVFPDFPRD